MSRVISRLCAAIASLVLCCGSVAFGQSTQPANDDAVFLVAHPAFRDAGYFHTVLIAAPVPGGGHVGVILNRPTNRSLFSIFPEHEPSKNVSEPVRYGGPFSPGALVALVKSETHPGVGTLPLMKNLYIAFRAATIDSVIEQRPNDARYFVGYVGWRPGELKSEIDRGLWAVVNANPDTVFQKDTSGLWEDLLAQTRRIQARMDGGPVLSNVTPRPPQALQPPLPHRLSWQTASSHSSSRP
jgi:putative transcriptional regulator